VCNEIHGECGATLSLATIAVTHRSRDEVTSQFEGH
jgi:hypothetical protein